MSRSRDIDYCDVLRFCIPHKILNNNNQRREPDAKFKIKHAPRMQRVFNLNDEGAALLVSFGDAQNALVCFTKALEILHQCCSFTLCPNSHTIESNRMLLELAPIPVSELYNKSLVCANAFAVHYPSYNPVPTSNEIDLCAAVIKYNGAMALQMHAGHGGDGYQRKAFSLYKECLGLLQSQSFNEGVVDVSRLTVACLLNMIEVLLDWDRMDVAVAFANLAQRLLETSEGESPLFDDDTMMAFGWAVYFVPYCASLHHAAAAA
jgi:hypothetical protein